MEQDFIENDEFDSQQAGTLNRKQHIESLIQGLTGRLSSDFEMLVPGQTWSIYWITHSLSLLEQPQFLETVIDDVIEFIGECAHKEGGYGGGPGQIAHLGTSFAAVNALITTSSEEALDSIDRVSLVRFLHRMKQPDGSFTMHDDGEIDSRATYCALAILRCLNIHDSILLENVTDWIISCQTYEGGFGSVPGSEAHGGYTFCCVASLCLLNQLHRADLSALTRWLTNKQLSDEGGFCGRSNKLVDSCYSYWQGAVFPLIHSYLKKIAPTSSTSYSSEGGTTSESSSDSSPAAPPPSRPNTRSTTRNKSNNATHTDIAFNGWIFDCAKLQDFILNQCQAEGGLLKDKPTAPPDFYHTCYALSGLSISQHQPGDNIFDIGNKAINILAPTHPLFNLSLSNLNNCFDYFRNKKIETFEETTPPSNGAD